MLHNNNPWTPIPLKLILASSANLHWRERASNMSHLTVASFLLLLTLPFGLAAPSDFELPFFRLLEATNNAAIVPNAPKTGEVSVQTDPIARIDNALPVRPSLAVKFKINGVLTTHKPFFNVSNAVENDINESAPWTQRRYPRRRRA